MKKLDGSGHEIESEERGNGDESTGYKGVVSGRESMALIACNHRVEFWEETPMINGRRKGMTTSWMTSAVGSHLSVRGREGPGSLRCWAASWDGMLHLFFFFYFPFSVLFIKSYLLHKNSK